MTRDNYIIHIKTVSENKCMFSLIYILPVYRDLNLRMYNDKEDKVKLFRETVGTSRRRRRAKKEGGYWGIINNKI